MDFQTDMACCGWNCDGCARYGAECGGCRKSHGALAHMCDFGAEVCEIYACCVIENELPDCAPCPEFPCGLYDTVISPSLPERDRENALMSRRIMLGAMQHPYS